MDRKDLGKVRGRAEKLAEYLELLYSGKRDRTLFDDYAEILNTAR